MGSKKRNHTYKGYNNNQQANKSSLPIPAYITNSIPPGDKVNKAESETEVLEKSSLDTASSNEQSTVMSVDTTPTEVKIVNEDTTTGTKITEQDVAFAKEQLPQDTLDVLVQEEQALSEEQAMAIVQQSKNQELQGFLKRQTEIVAQCRLSSQKLIDSYNEQSAERLKQWQEQESKFLQELSATGDKLCSERMAQLSSMLQQNSEKVLQGFTDLVSKQEEMLSNHFASRLQQINEQQQIMLDKSTEVISNIQDRVLKKWEDLDLNLKSLHAEEDSKLKLTRQELSARNEELDKYEQKLTEAQAKLLQETYAISQELDDGRRKLEQDKESYRKEIETRQNEVYKNLLSQHEAEVASFHAEKEQAMKELKQREAELESERNELDIDRALFEKQKAEHNQSIGKKLDEYSQAESIKLNSVIQRQEDQIKDLKEYIAGLEQERGRWQLWKLKFGDVSPEQKIKDMLAIEAENKRLREEIANLPSKDVLQQVGRLESENKRLSTQIDDLESSYNADKNASLELAKLESEVSQLEAEKDSLKATNRALNSELNTYRAMYGQEADRDKRIVAINNAYIEDVTSGGFIDESLSEIDWLEGIIKKCKENEFSFSKRIFYAFHTSLKIAEFSPLTVLSGVSGTGKSQLPYLYSKFGGINFMLLPVQPNWDCQEAMLGFFNPVEKVFEAQPVLRFLAQAQSGDQSPFGLQDQMNMILLDEMNLAHIELYFAEFLSKLESRRGKYGSDLPKLEVKLGSGLKPFELTLGRNVLWTGTMNQDETTKSLSDKVIDRSNMLYFPRPSSLISRKSIKGSSGEKDSYPRLKASVWEEQWVVNKIDFGQEIEEYKSILEKINQSMGVVGRALGHRVWQSIEGYMANYPTVKLAKENNDTDKLRQEMHTAFEDQLVMKVMPKLRGIETQGTSREECLDVIGKLLQDTGFKNLKDDFTKACDGSYGQFLWNSASYLDDKKNN